jgi:3-hydroxyacyl-CoA dehydrogenase
MKIAVVGTGVMGRGWITQFAMWGHEVACFDENRAALDGVSEACRRLAQKAAKKAGLNDPELSAKTVANIHTHATRDAFVEAARDAAVLLEAIFEEMELKCRVIGDIVPRLGVQTHFWSNTSGLDIDTLGEASGRPEQAIVTHGMNPVPMMPGVELVAGKKTAATTVELARRTLLEMHKVPFLAPNIPGFWVNRLLVPQMLDALRLLEQGKITVADGDLGLSTSLGHPQGTFKLADFVTLPTLLRLALEMYRTTSDPRLYPPQILARLVKDGEHGANSGKGLYDWSDPHAPRPRDMSHLVVSDLDDLLDNIK